MCDRGAQSGGIFQYRTCPQKRDKGAVTLGIKYADKKGINVKSVARFDRGAQSGGSFQGNT
jgi:hypothetical protein